VTLPSDLDELSAEALKELVIQLLGETAELKQTIAKLRAEIARLKGLKEAPAIKPSGMDKATDPPQPVPREKRSGHGKVRPRVCIEDRVLPIAAPPGSRFKGYKSSRCAAPASPKNG